MKNKKNLNTVLFIGILILIILYLFPIKKVQKGDVNSVWSPKTNSQLKTDNIVLNEENSKEFSHPSGSFSFRYPDDMKAEILKENEDSLEVILVQNAKDGKGFQVMISPFDEDIGNKLTEERIKQDVPDLLIKDAQSILIGENGFGLAFLSDNEDFSKNSREVWFVFNGFLYQISTYAHLDPILQAVFSTWQFK